MDYDLIIEGATLFDGTGSPGKLGYVGIREGRVAAVSAAPLDGQGGQVIDARGKWIVPGFIDCHTHYDAELLAAPALSESLRHGVTTVTVGSCSIGTVLSPPEDCSDMFTRVEALPREQVLPILTAHKYWSTPAEYADFLAQHPLGPNVAAFIGHSDIRARVMGLGRSVDPRAKPTEAELKDMERWTEAALDAGFLGLSTMTNPWDKLDGHRYRSAQLPSTYASWSEYRRLHRILRRRARVLQSAPNLVTAVNALLFLFESASFGLRKALRTTLITLADPKANPLLYALTSIITAVTRVVFRTDLRWQTLPVPFTVYADGIDLVVFEEFGAGQAALHLADEVRRNVLMKDQAYRRRFRHDYATRFSPRVWHRDFHDAYIDACPDARLVGKTFGQVADERGLHVVDLFLDLVVEHGRKLRWHTLIANHRPEVRARMMRNPDAILGFSDAGAHIRNMAFYSMPLRVLRAVRDAERKGRPIMPVARAVHRLTGEIAEWLGIDAGHLRVGDRADLVVIDPAALDDRLEAYHEAPMERFELTRMVNRSVGVVSAVFVNGKLAVRDGEPVPEVGRELGFGTFLRAHGWAPVVAQARFPPGQRQAAE